MLTITKSAGSINDAIVSKTLDRDKKRNGVIHADKYHVKIKDQNGKEYEIRYFF